MNSWTRGQHPANYTTYKQTYVQRKLSQREWSVWDGLLEKMGLEQDLKVLNRPWQKGNKAMMTSGKKQDLLIKRERLKRLSLEYCNEKHALINI